LKHCLTLLPVLIPKELLKYIDKRKSKDTEFSKGFDNGYEEFKIGETFKQTRKELGLTMIRMKISRQNTTRHLLSF
jgi:uncharacterized protein with von Willebrand factor type A (vWA) domain